MANTIKIKRRNSGGGAGAPSSLKTGEIAFNEADLHLYYGNGDDGSGNATSILSIILPTASQAEAEAGSVSTAWLTPQRFTQALAVLLGIRINAATAKTTPVGGDEMVISDSAASSATKKVTLTNLFGQFLTIGSSVVALVGDFLTASSTKLLTPDAMWDAADPLSTAYSSSLSLSVCGSSGRLHHIVGALTGNLELTLTDLKNGASGWVRVNASGGSRTVTCQTGSVAPSGQGMATRVWTIPSGETWYLFFIVVDSSTPVIVWSAAKDVE